MQVVAAHSRSIKAFAGEYVMIVLSIVTALALENGVRSYQQAREAQEAARSLDAEIALNIAETRSAIGHNTAQAQKVNGFKKILLADIKAGVGDKEAIRHTMAGQDFGVSMVTPSLQHEAWDVAVANQSLSHMPPAQLQRYAKQYASMRDLQAVLAGKGNGFLNLPQFSDTFSNFQMDELDARALYRILTQMGSLYETNASMLQDLEKQLVEEQRRTLKLAQR